MPARAAVCGLCVDLVRSAGPHDGDTRWIVVRIATEGQSPVFTRATLPRILNGDQHQVLGRIHDDGSAVDSDDSTEDLTVEAPLGGLGWDEEDTAVDFDPPRLADRGNEKIALTVKREVIGIHDPAYAALVEARDVGSLCLVRRVSAQREKLPVELSGAAVVVRFGDLDGVAQVDGLSVPILPGHGGYPCVRP